MSREQGDRVGAILSSNKGTVKFLGYGEYVGEEVPSKEAGGLASLIRESGRKNPKIELDDGTVVWGCECWWGDEKKVEKVLEDSDEIIEVDINQYRE